MGTVTFTLLGKVLEGTSHDRGFYSWYFYYMFFPSTVVDSCCVQELLNLTMAMTASLRGSSVSCLVLQATLGFNYLILLECWVYNKVRCTKHMLIILKWVVFCSPVNGKKLPNKCLLHVITLWKWSVKAGWCSTGKRISLSPGKNLIIFTTYKQCTQNQKNPMSLNSWHIQVLDCKPSTTFQSKIALKGDGYWFYSKMTILRYRWLLKCNTTKSELHWNQGSFSHCLNFIQWVSYSGISEKKRHLVKGKYWLLVSWWKTASSLLNPLSDT